MKRDYIDFQDRSVAKGYLITFRCYGTWFHGDKRGSIDRRFHNTYGSAKIKPNAEMVERKSGLMKGQPFLLGPRERDIVEATIREVCVYRGISFFGVNVRTNHAHSVVGNGGTPERIMNDFKTYSTRALRSAGLVGAEQKLWSRHGSTRYLWTDEHINQAVEYVVHGQGDELPRFE